MTDPVLSPEDRAALAGDEGEAARLAMKIVVALARASGAPRLIDVTRAHVDGCLYHGPASLDFARRLGDAGAQVAVPTTLNVGAIDLVHPDRFRGDPATAERARALMDAYVEMGCRPTWTCAPYQLPDRPRPGEQIAWAESNAIVFANSVLGARTARYGDFMDVCAAITGRVPEAGLHVEHNRAARILFRVAASAPEGAEDLFHAALGHVVGRRAGSVVPAISGLPPGTSEDDLKTLGAAAASSGSVALFHAIGVTPEADTVGDAFHGRAPEAEIAVGRAELAAACDELSTADAGPISAVSLGTPHFSASEFARLALLLDGVTLAPGVDLYVSTSRAVLAAARAVGSAQVCEAAGASIVTDTCTYVTPILRPGTRVVMTNSAKWAYYAPANVGVDVVLGSMADCVASAAAGEVRRDRGLWSS